MEREREPQLRQTTEIISAAELIDRSVVEAEAQWLIDNRELVPEVAVPRQERRDNARTAQMEALTASGHLSRVEISGESVEAIHQQVLSRLLNGYLYTTDRHEKQRAFAEICNELIIHRLHAQMADGELPDDLELTEISDFPETLPDQAAQKLGYRPKNKKGMVRATGLRRNADDTYTRVIEQVSRSNGTADTTLPLLRTIGAEVDDKPYDIAALERPILYSRRDLTDGVVDIMRRLDSYGNGLLYGDKDHAKHVGYQLLRKESARREAEIEHTLDALADLELQLDTLRDAGTINQAERDQIYGQQIETTLAAICSLRPEYAEDTYGRAAAGYFYQAADLIARGQLAQAQVILERADLVKETVTFCGMSISIEKAKEMGLSVNDFEGKVEEGKESWTWKQGVCRVENCPTRPGKTKIGPCSVCEQCQTKFDRGQDPTKSTFKGLLRMANKKQPAATSQKQAA